MQGGEDRRLILECDVSWHFSPCFCSVWDIWNQGRYRYSPSKRCPPTPPHLMVSLLCCLLGGLRGLAQSGAPWLRGGVDHRHQFAGGNPHLPAAGCAAVEGESGTHRCLQISHPGHWVTGLPRAAEPRKKAVAPHSTGTEGGSAPPLGRGWNLASSWITLEREKGPQSPHFVCPQKINPIQKGFCCHCFRRSAWFP